MGLFYTFVFTTILLTATVFGRPQIGKRLQQRFLLEEDDKSDSESVIVSFNRPISRVIDHINSLRFDDIVEKRNALVDAQIKFSNENQRDVQNALKLAGVKYETLWITNQMYIPKADFRLVKLLAQFPSVVNVELEEIASPELSANGSYNGQVEKVSSGVNRTAKISVLPWAIDRIGAPSVWQYYTGRGVVVANIDTGVRATHEALESNWRTQYGWYDAIDGSATPSDQYGRGTHTMGTLAGTNGIGVAPGATWIACKGCSNLGGCKSAALIKCGQWMVCPTLSNGKSKNCAMAPKIVSNSWGIKDANNEGFYDDVIKSWHAAGIIPVFSIGYDGLECATTRTPGNRPNTIGVAHMDKDEKILPTSSRGPGKSNKIKPDIAAPGQDILSSLHELNNVYGTFTGNSMAVPHVAGVIALMLQKNPQLRYNQIYKAITSTAMTTTINLNGAKTSGGKSPSTFPNNVFGYGRIDAVGAVNAV